MKARIFKPAKTAMQSGIRNTKLWVLEIEPEENTRFIEPIMGWTGSKDTPQQIRLKFKTKEMAIEYANKQGIAYTLIEPRSPSAKKKSYSDNFKFKKPAA